MSRADQLRDEIKRRYVTGEDEGLEWLRDYTLPLTMQDRRNIADKYGALLSQLTDAQAEIERLRAQPETIGDDAGAARKLIAAYFDREDAEYTPEEIRDGKADACIIAAISAMKGEG